MAATRVEIEAGSGIVVLRDAARQPRAQAKGGAEPDEALRDEARAAGLFYISSDDPVCWRIDVRLDAGPPARVPGFREQGGSFRVSVPSGELVLESHEAWTAPQADRPSWRTRVAAGDCLVQVFERAVPSGAEHEARMLQLVGSADWRFKTRVERFGLLGCLPLVLLALALLARRWRWALEYALPLLVLTWLPFVLLRRTRRYRDTAGAEAEHERGQAHLLLVVWPAPADCRVPGGSLQLGGSAG